MTARVVADYPLGVYPRAAWRATDHWLADPPRIGCFGREIQRRALAAGAKRDRRLGSELSLSRTAEWALNWHRHRPGARHAWP